MGRFSTDNSIEFKAFERQKGRCALCGKRLNKLNYEHGDTGAWEAHHIDGDPKNNNVSNCACLCINKPEECHLYAHHDDYLGDEVIPPSEYKHLYGN